MADPIRLTLHDHVLIHGLAIISRPELLQEHRMDLEMIVAIVRTALPKASADIAPLAPLLQLGRSLSDATPLRPGFYGSHHDAAREAMNRWDRQRMAAAWDAINGGKKV